MWLNKVSMKGGGGFDAELRLESGETFRVEGQLVDLPALERNLEDSHERVGFFGDDDGDDCSACRYKEAALAELLEAIQQYLETKSDDSLLRLRDAIRDAQVELL